MPKQLKLDPTKCDGVGICVLKAPDLITMDAWGFPIVDEHSLNAAGVKQARKAVNACPKRALMIIERD